MVVPVFKKNCDIRNFSCCIAIKLQVNCIAIMDTNVLLNLVLPGVMHYGLIKLLRS